MSTYTLRKVNELFEIVTSDNELIARQGCNGCSWRGWHNHWTEGMEGDYADYEDVIAAFEELEMSRESLLN